MQKEFNTTGLCIPEKHYMADVSGKVEQIAEFVERGKYFTINRARQYGKTTMLYLLNRHLQEKYLVICISFEAADEYFASQELFANGIVLEIADVLENNGEDEKLVAQWKEPICGMFPMRQLSHKITNLCKQSDKKVVLMIDEVDKNADNQIFLLFLGMLRDKYLKQESGQDTTFQSVILAGVYDIKNMKLRLRPEEEHKYNSPWNIAMDFDVDMSLSKKEIAVMLEEYGETEQIRIDIDWFSEQIYNYTSGYPYLVSQICCFLDTKVWKEQEFGGKEKKAAWTKKGFARAIKMILTNQSTLFDDIFKKINQFPKLESLLQSILIQGMEYPYNPDNAVIQLGVTFGLLEEKDGKVMISNRIFETRIYNWMISENEMNVSLYKAGADERFEFVKEKGLDISKILERFAIHYHSLYTDKNCKFLEDECRLLFLTFLKPIINGVGNYYVEARTRNQRRMDVVIDYLGKQYIIELKVWRGEAYEKEGQEQLTDYLISMEQEKGWLLTFCFNGKQEELVAAGFQEIEKKGKKIVSLVV